MGTFFREWLSKKSFLDDYTANKSTFRFYANAKQRCQLTARTFADALFPGEKPEVEMKVTFDTMGPARTTTAFELTPSTPASARIACAASTRRSTPLVFAPGRAFCFELISRSTAASPGGQGGGQIELESRSPNAAVRDRADHSTQALARASVESTKHPSNRA